MIQEMIEKSEDSIKEWDDHTSNSMDENLFKTLIM